MFYWKHKECASCIGNIQGVQVVLETATIEILVATSRIFNAIACGQELNCYIILDLSSVCFDIQGQFDTVTLRSHPSSTAAAAAARRGQFQAAL
jgi:hypothetical protein